MPQQRARHLATLVAKHIVDLHDAEEMIFDLANGLVKKAYKL